MGIGWVSVNDSTVKGTVPFHFAKDASGFFYMGQLGYSFFRKREAFAFLYHDRIAFFDFDGNHVNSEIKPYGLPLRRIIRSVIIVVLRVISMFMPLTGNQKMIRTIRIPCIWSNSIGMGIR